MTGFTAATNAIQWIVFVGMLSILVACGYLWATRPHRWPHIIPPGTWALHGGVFYSLVLSGLLPGGHPLTILLSAVLRLHAVLLVAGGLAIFIWRPRQQGIRRGHE